MSLTKVISAFSVFCVTILAAQSDAHLEVPFVPTAEPAVRAMLDLAGVRAGDVVYDLGSGDGRIVIAAARHYGAHAVGIDINPELNRIARENAKRAGVEHLVRFEEKDMYQVNLRPASVVTLFLLKSVNLKLRPKLLRELRPGARVVSHSFDMGEWKPAKKVTHRANSDPYLNPEMFLWIIPRNPPPFKRD
jgi:cyclopropane fatty-acyl-phospholipid synthase-like methyltransferase